MDDDAILERLRQIGASTLDEIAVDVGMSAHALQGVLEDLRVLDAVKRSPHARWFVPGYIQGSTSATVRDGAASRLKDVRRLSTYLRLCAFEEEGASARFESNGLGQAWMSWPGANEWTSAGGRVTELVGPQARGLIRAAGTPGVRIVYGYPTWVHRGANSWHAIPVMVQSAEVVQLSEDSVRLELADDYPVVNPAFLEATMDSPEERHQFIDNLGLLGEDVEAGVSIHACSVRLVDEGLPYPLEFVDELDLRCLTALDGSAELYDGVHNSAVVGLVDSLKDRKGLASELGEIAEASLSTLRTTALGSMVSAGPGRAPAGEVVLGDDLPLDAAQAAVVRAALSCPLTVVTGPPGTGKSQIVAAILANAMIRGERALLASYNHKAVAIVEQKLDGIAGFRALLRCGRSREDRCHFEEIAEEVGDFLGGVLPEGECAGGSLASHLAARRVELVREATEPAREAMLGLAEAAHSLQEGAWSAFPSWRRNFPAASKSLPLWCVTNLSAKWSFPLEPALFDLVVIDEASQCDIASAWPLLYRARRAVIIGDSRQLRHVTSVSPERARQFAGLAELSAGIGARTNYVAMSLFDCAAATVGEAQVMSLDGHYRSHPEIIGFPNKQWYDGAIKVLTDPKRLVLPGDLSLGMYWLPVRSTVSPGGTGVTAEDEARIIVDRLRALLVEGQFCGTVGVVTPFRAQRDLIQAMAEAQIDSTICTRADLLVKTAHGFQGDERDVIFFSPCLRPNITRGSFRFLRDTDNLLNVAVTRARSALVIVGDLEACRECGIEHYEALALYWDALRLTKVGIDRRAGDDEALFEKLAEWRACRALAEGVETRWILGDDALHAISAVRPMAKAQLALIRGVGAVKLKRFGDEILAVVAGERVKTGVE